MKKAFTLAEIMIALILIGFLTGVILIQSNRNMPDKNVVLFKKANNTLSNVIKQLTNSDKYFFEGDLGKKPDGTLIQDNKYLCDVLKDIISYGSSDCDKSDLYPEANLDIYGENIEEIKQGLAKFETLANTKQPGGTISASDNIIWIIPKALPYGAQDKNKCPSSDDFRLYSDPNGFNSPCFKDLSGFDSHYRAICFDTDELEKGEIPFCYGIRVDGKIATSPRVDEWINKSVHKKD